MSKEEGKEIKHITSMLGISSFLCLVSSYTQMPSRDQQTKTGLSPKQSPNWRLQLSVGPLDKNRDPPT